MNASGGDYLVTRLERGDQLLLLFALLLLGTDEQEIKDDADEDQWGKLGDRTGCLSGSGL